MEKLQIVFYNSNSSSDKRNGEIRMTKKPKVDTQVTASSTSKGPKTYPPEASFPIIGIGASAGGLEALQLFLGNIPEKSGMAFVVVQHLDPTHKGFLVDLLDRVTSMQVFQVKDSISVQPDCVYIIPPNKDLQLFHGALHLFDPVAPRGLRLPIDFLFRSMADDRQEQAIVVVLSGMGTDGTLGLKAIKEKGGAVFVQEPDQAKFNGMPKSAISTGLADVVATAEELPLKIIAYLNHKPLIASLEPDLADKDLINFEKIVILLRSRTGHDFSLYKKTTIYRRIDRRMGIHQIEKIENYIRFLQENPQELQVLFKELLIGVTSFFRDPEAWEHLKEQVFPVLFARHSAGQPLRAWVVGCSTGEEAYSLAIIFKEALEKFNPTANFPLQIFATDLDRDAIDVARQGFYTANISADVSPERLGRFFTQEEQGYRVNQEIRTMVVFAPQNVIMDPPFTRIDILSCRNLLIYLNRTLQKKLLALFHYSLNPGGFLFLGSAETTSSLTDLFEPSKGKWRFYRRLEPTLLTEPVEFPSAVFHDPRIVPDTSITQQRALKHAPNLEDLTNQLILEHYSPAAVLVSDKGDILYTRGRTGKYLEPAAGKANWNIFAMARAGLHYKLHKTFQKAVRQNISVTLKNVTVDTGAGKQAVDVTVQPLKETELLRRQVMIVFTNARNIPESKAAGRTPQAPAQRNRVGELEAELGKARQELQRLLRETQTSKEECLSAYEELQSTNEELQSTSEEITTSKEELQSLNEELQTLNYELQRKVDELSQTNNDMKNLLDSTDIATLFLDNSLHVRRFTPQTAEIIKLIPGDTGRPITDIVSKLNYPELAEDAQEVLRKLVHIEKSISASDGRWFSVRIMPYRTLENKIDGLVITFTDITNSKMLEFALRQTQADMEKRMAEEGMELGMAEDTAS
jgi:two-component system, chemotaxis family, CheB/CheR fusion protein